MILDYFGDLGLFVGHTDLSHTYPKRVLCAFRFAEPRVWGLGSSRLGSFFGILIDHPMEHIRLLGFVGWPTDAGFVQRVSRSTRFPAKFIRSMHALLTNLWEPALSSIWGASCWRPRVSRNDHLKGSRGKCLIWGDKHSAPNSGEATIVPQTCHLWGDKHVGDEHSGDKHFNPTQLQPQHIFSPIATALS